MFMISCGGAAVTADRSTSLRKSCAETILDSIPVLLFCCEQAQNTQSFALNWMCCAEPKKTKQIVLLVVLTCCTISGVGSSNCGFFHWKLLFGL